MEIAKLTMRLTDCLGEYVNYSAYVNGKTELCAEGVMSSLRPYFHLPSNWPKKFHFSLHDRPAKDRLKIRFGMEDVFGVIFSTELMPGGERDGFLTHTVSFSIRLEKWMLEKCKTAYLQVEYEE